MLPLSYPIEFSIPCFSQPITLPWGPGNLSLVGTGKVTCSDRCYGPSGKKKNYAVQVYFSALIISTRAPVLFIHVSLIQSLTHSQSLFPFLSLFLNFRMKSLNFASLASETLQGVSSFLRIFPQQ